MRAIDAEWPKTIRVGAFDWKIVVVPPDRHTMGRRYTGVTDTHTLTIEIAGHLDMQRAVETFMHELLHAIFVQQQYPGGEEATVCVLSPALINLWRDNPGLHAWMMRHAARR